MLWSLGRRDLEATIERMGADSAETALRPETAPEDPDAGITDIAYEKGSFFLRTLEEAAGRERFDPFLRSWFDEHAFRSVTSEHFLAYLEAELLEPAGLAANELDIETWVYGPGLPANAPQPDAARFDAVAAERGRFLAGTPAADLAVEGWSTHEWLEFLRGLPEDLSSGQMADLDSAFALTDSRNSEIRFFWYLRAIATDYQPAYPKLAEFLTEQGRRKFVAPLFAALAESEEGKQRAMEIYEEARPGYHPLTQGTVDRDLGWEG
jgi:hypothetical protein